ncbi:MAG: hypothetical protein K0B10_08325 [Vicingaceae bacterium]|nr:hypothetical protein [Vicingaceae bacterium]
MIELKTNSDLSVLLEKVEEKYPFEILHSKDCDNLAQDILQVTGERVSGSTIKRLFGFIKSKSNPNNYTLNVLAKYIGNEDYQCFLKKYQLAETVKNNNTISGFIEYAKANSLTNPKKWVTHTSGLRFIADFIASDASVTAIIAEGGMGKTILLAQFLENYQQSCFALCGSPLKRKDLSLCEHLTALKDKYDLIIIDEIEETAYNFLEIRTIFFELAKFLSQHNNVKIIISIRPYTWVRLSDVFSSNLQNKWFGVNFNTFKSEQCVNLDTIRLDKLNADNELFISTPFLSPFYLELLEKNQQKTFTNDWAILNQFFTEKVWKTAYAYEKKLFFDKIMELTNNGKEGGRITRKDIQDIISKYKKAHVDLVSYNILKEEKELNKYGAYSSFYSFGNAAFLEFYILSRLLTKYDGFNNALLKEIANEYEDERKLNLLKLAVSYALHQYDKAVVQVFDLALNEFERQSLMVHIGYQIRLDKKLQEEVFPQFVKTENGRKFFIERWINEEHLNGFYGKGLEQYLQIVTEPQDVIFANALLYYNAFLNKNTAECEKRAAIIKNIETKSNSIHPFVMGRKYMTLLLEEHRINKKYSKTIKEEIEQLLTCGLTERDEDLPVHFAGFEFNILHAEFLTNTYVFTEQLLKKLIKSKRQLLHPKDADEVLLKFFESAYYKVLVGEIKLEGIHPWYRYTVKNYLNRVCL